MDISRHRELFNAEKFDTPIHVIGAGATGSWVVLMLASLGIKGEYINVYDFDTVEEHNIPNQAFGFGNIGEEKATAIKDIVRGKTGTEIKTHGKFTNQRLSGYVFLMVDSMAERKRIWNNAVKFKGVHLLIEPRMGIDVGRIYNINPKNINHIKRYEETYYSDDVAEVSACGTSLTVITTAMSLAGMVTRQLINHQNGIALDQEILIDFMYNNIETTVFD